MLFEDDALPIFVSESPTKGREFFSKTNILKQETVFRVYPYSTAIFDSFRKKVCAHCLCTHPTRSFSSHCIDCDQVYFCSKACHELYLEADHSMVCKVLRQLATLKADKHQKSVAKAVICTLWERQYEKQHGRHRIAIAAEKMRKKAGAAVMDEEERVALYSSFDHVDALESHYHHWPESEKPEWRKVQQFMYSHLKDIGLLEPNETETDIMHLVSKIESNGFGLALEEKENDTNKKKSSTSVTLGRMLFPLASLLNHDCDCNCEVEQRTDKNISEEEIPALTAQVESLDIPKNNEDDSQNGNNNNINDNNNSNNSSNTNNNNTNNNKGSKKSKKKKQTAKMIKDTQRQLMPTYPPIFSQPRGVFRMMRIRAIRDIQVGSALTISYIDSTLPVAARRQRLLDDYYFSCLCDRCKLELKL